MSTADIVRGALLTALVAVVTRLVQIPTPGTQGYVNMGDAVIVAGGLLLGGRMGGLAGGIGSALADLTSGYAHYAPFTLVIKGVEGLLVGGLAAAMRPDLRRPAGLALAVLLAVIGAGWMVAGYCGVEFYLYGPGPALANAPANVAQALAGVICGVPLAAALGRRFRQKALD